MGQVARLDYSKADIRMFCDTDYERTKRITAASKEVETVSWLEGLEPGIFFDVGANVGSYSLIAETLGHTVYAFEPHEPTFHRLKQNIGLNESEVCAFKILLSEDDEVVNFIWSSEEMGSALHRTTKEPSQKGHRLHAWKLDSFRHHYGLPQPDYIKIDTDGHELPVLLGASDTLKGVKSLLVEMDYDDERGLALIPAYLDDLGFKIVGRYPHGTSPVANWVWARNGMHCRG